MTDFRNTPKIIGLLVLLQIYNYCGATPEMLEALKHNTDRWIEIKQRLSEEQINWESEKEILRNSLVTLQDSKKKLEDRIQLSELETQSTKQEIESAQAQMEEVKQTTEQLNEDVVAYENRILQMSSLFPDPLREELQTNLAKIPKERSERDAAGLAHRLLNVVTVMTAIDEFNNEVHEVHTIRETENGALDLQILYWGLAGAYACDATGSQAWRLTPGEEQWDWIPIHSQAANVRKLFEVYEKSTDPELIAVPFVLQTEEISL